MKWINKRSPQTLDSGIRFTFLKTVLPYLSRIVSTCSLIVQGQMYQDPGRFLAAYSKRILIRLSNSVAFDKIGSSFRSMSKNILT